MNVIDQIQSGVAIQQNDCSCELNKLEMTCYKLEDGQHFSVESSFIKTIMEKTNGNPENLKQEDIVLNPDFFKKNN